MLTIVIIIATTIIYCYLKYIYQYWQKRGVDGPKPKFLIGNLGPSVIWRISSGEIFADIYNKYNNAAIVGLYRGVTPVLMLRDPELIKEVTITSFHSFYDNDVFIDKKTDPLWGRNTFVLKGEEWKLYRGQITPGLTSSKIKWFYPDLEKNANEFVKYVEENEIEVDCDLKTLTLKFTLNNIASCAFGLKGKCFEEENSEIKQLAAEMFQPGNWGALVFYLVTTIPSLAKFLPLRLITKSCTEKLQNLVSETLKYREENNIVRNDFLHMMYQVKKASKDHEITDIDVTAHVASFFLDGFETSSSVLSFVLYLLALNPIAQAKLRQEVQEAFESNGKKISCDVIQSLPYLDSVLNESLRHFPVLPYMQKMCTKTYTFSDGLKVEKGTPIIIPVYGLHHDPKYFEDPDQFKPERFMGNNRENLTKHTFLPFGEGPRACLGQKFGSIQVKTGVAVIVKNFDLGPSGQMKLPLKFDPSYIMIWPVGGLWIKFKRLNKN